VPVLLRPLLRAVALVSGDRPHDTLSQIQALRSQTEKPIIVFSKDQKDSLGTFALELGADLVLPIDSTDVFVQGSVKALLRRLKAYHDLGQGLAKRLSCGHLQMDLSCHVARWRGTEVRLTVTEFALLHALAKRPMQVMRRAQLQDVLYGNRIFVEDRTIDSHIKRLRKKLRDVDPQFDAIDTLYGVGYRFRVEEQPVRAAPRLQSVS